MYLSLHCRHQNDSCVKLGSDERHFGISLIGTDRATRQCPQTTTFLEREESRGQNRFEPRSLCLPANAVPLGQNRLTNNTSRRPGRCCYSASPSLLAVYLLAGGTSLPLLGVSY